MQANENREDFEELLAALAAGEIDAAGLRELNRLTQDDPRLAERHRRFVETLDALNLPGPGAFEIPELEQRNGNPAPGKAERGGRMRIWRPVLAAAALLICVPLLLSLFLPDDSRPPDRGATLTHVRGACYSGSEDRTPAKPGAPLAVPELSTGPNSICDLQFGAPARMKLRLLSNSRLKFVAHERHLNLSLERGEALVDAEKLPANVRVSLHTAGHLIEVLGTQLVLRRPRFESFQVELLAGAAHLRSAHYLHIDGLRHGLHTESGHHANIAERFPELFAETRHVLTAGAHLHFAHPEDFARKTAPLLRRLNAHVLGEDSPTHEATEDPADRDHAPVNAAGSHEVSPELIERLRATYAGHAHLHDHFRDGPPPGKAGTISPDRARSLKGHFADLQARANAAR